MIKRYTIHDSIKPSWIEREFNDVDTTGLYKCRFVNNFLNYERGLDNCENENDEVTDHSDWINLLKTIDASNTREEMDKVLDTDLFIKNMVAEWLFGSWDRFNILGHNYFMYKNLSTNKWMFIPYDFDSELGSDIYGGSFYNKNLMTYVYNWPYLTYKDFAGPGPRHILETLIFNNETTFIEHTKTLVRDVFNPVVLFDHIDEVKKLIDPYVLEDKTEDPETGLRPGRINLQGKTDWDYMSFVVNSEFTTVSGVFQASYGLKRWILDKFRFICKLYDMDCSFGADYLEGGSFTYEINEEYENPGASMIGDAPWELEASSSTVVETETEVPTATGTEIPKTTAVEATPTETVAAEDTCWSEVFDYPCCETSCKVYDEDENGEWGYEDDHWCGILTDICRKKTEECWSIPLGYPCCQKATKVYDVDDDGSWSYEDHHWCGLLNTN